MLLILLILLEIFIIYIFFIRNYLVYKYRIKMIDEISKLSNQDIDNGNYDWEWRYVRKDIISYNEMVFKFWKPIKSFFLPVKEWKR